MNNSKYCVPCVCTGSGRKRSCVRHVINFIPGRSREANADAYK